MDEGADGGWSARRGSTAAELEFTRRRDMREASLTDRQKTDEALYGSYDPRVGGREVRAQSKDGSHTRRGGAAMNSTATELEVTRRRAVRAIVKGFVVGTLGLAVLVGSPAVSLALKPTDPVVNCQRQTVDTFLCVIGGKEYICPSPQTTPKGCKAAITQTPGGTRVPKGVTPPVGTLQK
jgi:hypothetical protein